MSKKILKGLDELKQFKYPEIIFILIFLFAYLPYFIYVQTPKINWDSWVYLMMAKDIYESNIPLTGYIYDVPYGLSLIIYLVFKSGGSLYSLVYIQVIINFIASIFLINQVKRLNKQMALLFSFLLALFMITSEAMLHNVMIYTESIYTAGLIFVTASLIGFYRKKSWKYSILLSTGIFFVIILRSNGIFILFIPLLLITYYIIRKNNLWIKIIIPLFGALILISTSHFFVKGYFAPIEIKRFKRMTNVYLPNNTNQKNQSSDSEQDSIKCERKIKVLKNIGDPTMGNFYYYRMLKAYNFISNKKTVINFVKDNIRYKEEIKEEELVNFMYTNLKLNSKTHQRLPSRLDIDKKPRHFWLFANHILHRMRFLWRNDIVVALFYLCFAISIFMSFSNIKKQKDKTFWKLIFIIGSIHALNILFYWYIAPRETSLMRYCFVTEFAAYLMIFMTIIEIKNTFFKQSTMINKSIK